MQGKIEKKMQVFWSSIPEGVYCKKLQNPNGYNHITNLLIIWKRYWTCKIKISQGWIRRLATISPASRDKHCY